MSLDFRDELIIDMHGDTADKASCTEAAELHASIQTTLRSLSDATAINTKQCIVCNSLIPAGRKKLVPSAVTCLPCAQQQEQHNAKPWLR